MYYSEPEQLIEEIQKAEYCGDLFEQDEKKIRQKYRECAKLIHPDICRIDGAPRAFAKLNYLYARALDRLGKGIWEESNILRLEDLSPMKYLWTEPFELGRWYVSDDRMVYEFDEDKLKYISRYAHARKYIQYADNRMANLFRKKMGVVELYCKKAIIVRKDVHDYPLGRFMEVMKGHLSGRDIAWMVSRLMDLCCFLRYSRLVLNGFCESNLLINPTEHSITISGGWWYTILEGKPMTGTNRTVLEQMLTSVRTSKKASYTTDIECVKGLARKLIACAHDVPKELVSWAESGSSDNAITEYGRWNAALEKAYGQRRFEKMANIHDRIYARGGTI